MSNNIAILERLINENRLKCFSKKKKEKISYYTFQNVHHIYLILLTRLKRYHIAIIPKISSLNDVTVLWEVISNKKFVTNFGMASKQIPHARNLYPLPHQEYLNTYSSYGTTLYSLFLLLYI